MAQFVTKVLVKVIGYVIEPLGSMLFEVNVQNHFIVLCYCSVRISFNLFFWVFPPRPLAIASLAAYETSRLDVLNHTNDNHRAHDSWNGHCPSEY